MWCIDFNEAVPEGCRMAVPERWFHPIPEPSPQLGMDLWATQQLEVSCLVADPLVGLREAERARGIRVSSECAIQRNEAVAHEPLGEQAAP
jgi:hypothetical protein